MGRSYERSLHELVTYHGARRFSPAYIRDADFEPAYVLHLSKSLSAMGIAETNELPSARCIICRNDPPVGITILTLIAERGSFTLLEPAMDQGFTHTIYR